MNRDCIVDSLGRIDEELIAEAEALRNKKKRPMWVKWSVPAACLILAALGAYLLFGSAASGAASAPEELLQWGAEQEVVPDSPVLPQEDKDDPVLPAEDNGERWMADFNEATAVLSAGRAYIQGYFTEDLSEAELAALVPAMRTDCAGYAGFDQDGNLLDVFLTVTTNVPDCPVTVSIAAYSFGADYELPGEAVISVCNGVEYTVWQYEMSEKVLLGADTRINDLYVVFSMEVSKEQLVQAKTDFQYVLACFAHDDEGKPDLTVIVPEEIPQLSEQIFNTLTEAQTEPDFGRYLPSALPAGFGDAAIRRFRFQDANYLSGTWTNGMNQLNWVVSPYTEAHAHRLTDVDDKENYDLSLYPIPRADSVPDALREIVDDPIFEAEELTMDAISCRAYKANDAGDTDGWRMKFSVKYGDVLVSVSAKGIDPQWLYQQLVNMLDG